MSDHACDLDDSVKTTIFKGAAYISPFPKENVSWTTLVWTVAPASDLLNFVTSQYYE